jgi:hypothetical protein
MSDYMTGLRQDLVEAAARQQRRRPLARPLHPRAWSPLALAGAGAALVAVFVLVAGLRLISPPRQPARPAIVTTVHLAAAPRDAVAVDGRLVIADYDGGLLGVGRDGREVRALSGAGQAVSVAADGHAVWAVVLSDERPPRFELVKLDTRTGRRLAVLPVDAAPDIVVAPGGVRLLPAVLREGSLENLRFGDGTPARTLLGPATDALAVTARTVWALRGGTLYELDDTGRVLHRTEGLAPAIAVYSPRLLLPDADGTWAVGQSRGELYRVEGGDVVKRIRVGETAGVVARSGSTVWVSATSAPGRYELVRVDADAGEVTGRLALGSRAPQVIVPLGEELWVITSGGDAVVVDPDGPARR